MLLVGGGAVNFHGYQRHSADVDFWIDTRPENLQNLLNVLREMGFIVDDFPEDVKNQKQNISLKFSPADFDVELITRFAVNKSFDDAFAQSIDAQVEGTPVMRFRVLSLEDLMLSKVKAGRPKDLLDIQQLQKINNL